MFSSAILDTAIDLVFVFLAVSLVVSAGNELMVALFQLRAKNLLLGIQELLQDPSVEGLVTRFYASPEVSPELIPLCAIQLRTQRIRLWKAGLAQGPPGAQLSAATEAIANLALPIGWAKRGLGTTTIFGWLITALAASLRAPLWYDRLNKFVNVRAAGKAPEEEPKPPKAVPIP
jgi:hypothetical protein